MWTSSLLKRNGWNSVKSHYWTAFGVMIVMTILSGVAMWILSIILGVASFIFGVNSDEDELLLSLMGLAAGLIVTVYVVSILETGKNRYFYRSRSGDVDLGNLFWAFQGGRYTPIAKIMFFRYLWTMLWSLLLYIPGIIKYYEYMLIPYLLAENPNLSKDRVFEISKLTMHGEKLKCFLLQLSFAIWIILIYLLIYVVLFGIFSLLSAILGAILLVLVSYIGIFALLPYYEATMAEFYACMRAKMLAMGITTEAELTGNYNNNYNNYGGGFPNNPYQNPYQQSPYQNPNPYDSQSPYQNPNPYEPQSPYQNPNPYEPQSPYQNPNPYEPQSPYQNPNSEENHKVNLDKDSDNHNSY